MLRPQLWDEGERIEEGIQSMINLMLAGSDIVSGIQKRLHSIMWRDPATTRQAQQIELPSILSLESVDT